MSEILNEVKALADAVDEQTGRLESAPLVIRMIDEFRILEEEIRTLKEKIDKINALIEAQTETTVFIEAIKEIMK